MYVRCDSCGWLDCTRCDEMYRIPGMPPTRVERGFCRRCGNRVSQETCFWEIDGVEHRAGCPNEKDFNGIPQADPTGVAWRSARIS